MERIIVAPVGVSVLHEYVSVLSEHAVAAPSSCRCVEVEDYLTAALFLNSVEQRAQILFGGLRRDLKSVNLEHRYSVLSPQSEYRVGILAPVGEVVLHAGIVPKADADAELLALLDDWTQAVGELHGVRFPVILVAPDVLERAFRHLRVGAFAYLPAVVELEHGDTEPRGAVEFGKAERLVYLGILAAVAPCVEHNHLVAVASGGLFEARLPLVVVQGGKSLALAAAKHAGDNAVNGCPAVRSYVAGSRSKAGNLEVSVLRAEVVAGVMELR